MRDLYDSTSKVQARYTYSVMGLRLSEQLDSLPLLLSNMSNSGNSGVLDGVLHANQTNADDLVFFIATDMRANICNKARVATYRSTDTSPKESFIHHDDRVRGPMTSGGGGGGPVARDREASLKSTPENWASIAADTDRFERSYYFADYRGNVSAILTHEGKLVEHIRYSANGVPFNIPLGDINADGKVESGTGEDQHKDLETNGPYHICGDFDLDGDIDAADNAIVTAKNTNTTGRGYLTLKNNDHRIMQPGVEFGGFNFGIAYNQTNQSAVHLTVNIVITMPDDGGGGGGLSPAPNRNPYPRTPFPSSAFPANSEVRHQYCHRWALYTIYNRDATYTNTGCAAHGTDAAYTCCMNSHDEAKCTTKGAEAVANCNSWPSDIDRRNCFSSCVDNAASFQCDAACIGCDVGPWEIVVCVVGCRVRIMPNAPRSIYQASYKACLKACFILAALERTALCSLCFSCLATTFVFCYDECYHNY